MAAMFGFNSFNQKVLSSLSVEDDLAPGTPMISLSASNRDLLSALLTGVEASLLLSPLELIRIQGQNRGKGGLIQSTIYCYHEIGVRGIMTTGMVSCMNREAKYCLGQFAAIGIMSNYLEKWSQNHHQESVIAAHIHKSSDVRAILSSISVGFICTILSHPDDVVKTRQQTRIPSNKVINSEYQTYFSSLKHVAKNEGVLALWKGSFWRCCVRVPLGLAVINVIHPRIRARLEEKFL
jgi:hypothetical protein